MTQAWQRFPDHIRLHVRLTPSAGRDALDTVEADGAGEIYLKARVTAVPEKGKANAALIALIAKACGLAKSSLSIVAGETARKKILRIDGDPEAIAAKLENGLRKA